MVDRMENFILDSWGVVCCCVGMLCKSDGDGGGGTW